MTVMMQICWLTRGRVDHCKKTPTLIIERPVGGLQYVSAQVSIADFARLTFSSVRSVQRWLQHNAFPGWVQPFCDLLLLGKLADPAFEGFYVRDGKIFTPADHGIPAPQFEAIVWNYQQVRVFDRRIDELEQQLATANAATEFWRDKAGAGSAANDEI